MVNGLQNFCVYFYILALLLKRKEGRRKPDGTAYQPKIECSAPEKPLQQMTGVGQVNMIFLRFKPSLFFSPLFFFTSWGMQFCNEGCEKVKRERIQGANCKRGQIFFFFFY